MSPDREGKIPPKVEFFVNQLTVKHEAASLGILPNKAEQELFINCEKVLSALKTVGHTQDELAKRMITGTRWYMQRSANAVLSSKIAEFDRLMTAKKTRIELYQELPYDLLMGTAPRAENGEVVYPIYISATATSADTSLFSLAGTFAKEVHYVEGLIEQEKDLANLPPSLRASALERRMSSPEFGLTIEANGWATVAQGVISHTGLIGFKGLGPHAFEIASAYIENGSNPAGEGWRQFVATRLSTL